MVKELNTGVFFRALAVALSITSGCNGTLEEPTTSVVGKDGNETLVTHAAGTGDIVAMVNSVPIFSNDVLRTVEESKGQLSVEEALDRHVEFELLSKEAENRGYMADGNIQKEWKKALVRELLYEEFVTKHGLAAIREDDYDFWYRRAYQRFVHEDGYFGSDAQFVCCHESDLSKCKEDPEVQTCFDAQEAAMKWVHAELERRGPFPTKEAFQETITALASAVPSSVPLAQINVTFWYEPGVPYEEQTGYTKLNTALVEAIVKTEVGAYTEPVRSNHGWHVSYLYEHKPKKNLPVTDPSVREEIAAHVYPLVQKRDYAFLTKKLETDTPSEIVPDLLLKLTD